VVSGYRVAVSDLVEFDFGWVFKRPRRRREGPYERARGFAFGTSMALCP